MNPHTKGYLEGLQAAALICQEQAGERNSHLSDKIMALHARKMLEDELIVVYQVTPIGTEIKLDNDKFYYMTKDGLKEIKHGN